MKKRNLSILLVLSMSLSMFGCSSNKQTAKDYVEDIQEGIIWELSETDTQKETSVVDNGKLSINATKVKAEVDSLVSQLGDEDYTDIKNYFLCDDITYVTDEDIEWYLPRTEISFLVGNTGSVDSFIVTYESPTSVTAAITIGSEEAVVTYELDNDNQWKLSTGMFVKGYQLEVPGNTQLFIDGIEVSTDLITGKTGSTELLSVYTIPTLVKKEKTFKIISSNYGEFEFNITPTSQTEPESLSSKVALSSEDLEEMYLWIKTSWNEMYQYYVSGADVSEITKYFVESMDMDSINEVYNSFGKLDGNNYSMTGAIAQEETTSYLCSNTVVGLNFNYAMSWYQSIDYNMRKNSGIYLEKTEEGYKIYKVAYYELFSESNMFTNEK